MEAANFLRPLSDPYRFGYGAERQRLGEQAVRTFTGWMFASSPALNALEHPVYDVWVLDCKDKITE